MEGEEENEGNMVHVYKGMRKLAQIFIFCLCNKIVT